MSPQRDGLWQAIHNADAPCPCPHFAHRQRAGWDTCAECETDAIHAAVVKHLDEFVAQLRADGQPHAADLLDELLESARSDDPIVPTPLPGPIDDHVEHIDGPIPTADRPATVRRTRRSGSAR